MRDETLRFLLEGSGITLEDEIHIFLSNYSHIIYMWRVIQVQIVTDQQRRTEADKMLDGFRDEEENEKKELKAAKEELKELKAVPAVNQDDDAIQDTRGNIKSLESKVKSLANDIADQKAIAYESREIKFYLKDLDPSDLSVRLVMKYWKLIHRVERMDYKVRNILGTCGYKFGDECSEFITWAARNTGSKSLGDLDILCSKLPEYFRNKFKANIETHKHIPRDE